MVNSCNKNRRVDLDLMRIIACFLVIFNHLPGYTLYQVANTLIKTWIYMFLTMVTRINVPLFFMISGSLLLAGTDESYRHILKKRVSRICAVLLIFTLILYFLTLGKTFKGFSLSFYLKQLIGGPEQLWGGGSYWYLYSYVGFLLVLPFLRSISKNLQKKDFIFLLVIRFIFSSCVDIVNLFISIRGYSSIIISNDFIDSLHVALGRSVFYPLIGYYLDHEININNIKRKSWIILSLCIFGGIFTSCLCTYYEGISSGSGFTQNYVMLFDYLSTIGAFLFIKKFCSKHNFQDLGGKINFFGSLTFGIYLIDPILKYFLYANFEQLLEPYLITIIVSLLWCVFSLMVGGTITFLLKKIPPFNNLI